MKFSTYIISCGLLALELCADTNTWQSATSPGDWTNTGNWSSQTLPTSSTTAIFPDNSGSYTVTVDTAAQTAGTLQFTANTNIVTISGQGLNLYSGINVLGPAAPLISSNIAMMSSSSFAVNLSGGNLTINGVIACSNVMTISGGSLFLGGANTYSGTTEVQNQANLSASANNCFSPNSTVHLDDGASMNCNTFSNLTVATVTTQGILSTDTNFPVLNLNETTLTFSAPSGIFYGQITDNGQSAPGGLTLSGSGTFTIATPNSTWNDYYGPTTINGTATLKVGAPNALSQNSALAITNGVLDISATQATQVTIANLGGTGNANVNLGVNELIFGSDNNLSSFAGAITTGGSGWTFHKVGTNNFTLTGTISSTNAGTIEIDSGQFIVSGSDILGSNSSIAMSGTSILDVSASSSNNQIANLSGATGNQVKIGSNTLTINDTAANTFAGTIYGGTNSIFAKTGSTTLTLSNAGAFTNFQGGLSLTGGNLLLQQTTALTIQSLNGSGTLTLDNSHLIVTLGGSSNVGTFSGGITGSGGLTLPASTTFTMTGSNTYLGSTTLEGDAVLKASGSNNNSTIVMDSTTVINLQGDYSVGAINDPQGFGQTAGTVNLSTYNLSIKAPAGTFSGAIPVDIGSVTVTNAGTWTIASDENDNAYTGTTSITNNAILSVTNVNALSKASPISLGTSGELSLAADVEVGGLTSTDSTDSTGIIQLGANQLTVNLNSTLSTFGGQITSNDPNLASPTNGLTLKGAGTLTLSGTSNNYTGTTILNIGAILTGNAGSLSPKSIINLLDTSQLNVNGTNKINDLTDDGLGQSKITLAAGTLTIQGNVNTGSSGTYTGQITGQGNLIVTNSGTLILNNTLGLATNYQGTTTISSYANITANSSKSLSPNSSVILTTGLLTLDPPLLSDAITIKDLTADGTSQVNIIKGTLILGGSSQSTSCSAYIFGDGGITKQNASTFTLITLPDNPINVYSGPTTITGGTLAAGSDSAFSEQSIITLTQGILDANVYKSAIPDLNGSSHTTITIASGGVLTIGVVTSPAQTSPIGTYSGQIKGNGGFGLDNSATYTLNPNSLPNSYYGVTNITGNSKLSAGQQNSFSPNSVVNIDSGSTLDVAGHTNTIGGLKGSGTVDLGTGTGNTLSIGGINPPSPFSGQITGAMGIKKIGAGSLTLSGTSNNYTGPTEVNGGSLVINGEITSTTTVTVDAGGTLKGTGQITGDVLCSGTTAPGNSIGTLSLIGDYTALPGSNFQVETNATIADKLNVIGTFTINTNATLTVLPYKGLYTPGTPYVIVETTGGVSGTFHPVVTTLTKAQVDVDYTDPNKVILYLTIKAFSDIGLSWNAINVAGALDRIMSIDPPEWSEELDTLFYLSESDLNIALNQLDPAQLKGFSIIQQNNAVRVQNGISLRFQNFLDKMKCPRLRGCNFKKSPVYFWVDGFNGKLRQPSNLVDTNPQVGYRANTGGGSMGIDMNFLKHGFVGLMGAGTYSDVKWVKGQGSGHITSAYAGIYASWLKEKQFANFSLLGATSSYSAHRNIIYPGVYETAKSEHNGLQLLTHLDLGLNFQAFGITVRPFESLDFIIQHENAFQESNAHVYNLDVQKTNPQMFRNELGLTFAKCFNAWKKSRILADLKLSWVSESRMKGTLFTSNFINFDEITFQTKGYYPNRNFFSPGASLTGNFFKDTAYITVSYDAEIGNHYLDQRTGLQIGIKF